MNISLHEAKSLLNSNSDPKAGWKTDWEILDDNDERVVYIRASSNQLLWVGFDGRCFIS